MQKTSNTLSVKERTGAGKGAARAERRAGMIPGVIYGEKKPPVLFSIPSRMLDAEMKKKGFWTRQFDIDVGGKEKTHAICQDVQTDPVTDAPVHIDFLRISKETHLFIEVPVVFTGEAVSPGLKLGGVLNVVTRVIEVTGRPDDIPENITVDLSALDINESVHASSVKLPAGVTFTDQSDFPIASIMPARAEEAAPVAAAADAAAPAAGGAAPAAGAAAPAAGAKAAEKK